MLVIPAAIAALATAATIPFWIKSGATEPLTILDRSTWPQAPPVASSISVPVNPKAKPSVVVAAKSKPRPVVVVAVKPKPKPTAVAVVAAKPKPTPAAVVAVKPKTPVAVAAVKPKPKPAAVVAAKLKPKPTVVVMLAKPKLASTLAGPAKAQAVALARLKIAEEKALARQQQAVIWVNKLIALKAHEQRAAAADKRQALAAQIAAGKPKPLRVAQNPTLAAGPRQVSTPSYTGPASGPVELPTDTFVPPIPTDHPTPSVPLALLNREIHETYVGIIEVSPTGVPTVSTVHSTGIALLDQETIRTLRYWRFQPATDNGQPTIAHYRVVFRFDVRLDNGLGMAGAPIIPNRPTTAPPIPTED